jgi:hypothetical protein
MNTALLDNLEDERTTPPKQRGLKIRDWMRQLRLQILLIRIGRPSSLRNSAERRKVAIHHNRRLAILHVLLHLIPLGGAIALLYLQWSSFFLSFTSPADSTVLQFVAKFHELLMQVSIVEITVCIIRHCAGNAAIVHLVSGLYFSFCVSSSLRLAQSPICYSNTDVTHQYRSGRTFERSPHDSSLG